MVSQIFYGILLICAFHAYGMSCIWHGYRLSYVSAKALAYVYGYPYIVQLRKENKHTIDLPPKQFEAVKRTMMLHLDLQRYIKAYIGIGALKTLWAQSYTLKKTLPMPGGICTFTHPSTEMRREVVAVDYAPNGSLVAAYTGGVAQLWQPPLYNKPVSFQIDMCVKTALFSAPHCLLTASSDTMYHFDVATLKPTAQFKKPTSVLILNNEPQMCVGGGVVLSLEWCREKTHVLQWDLRYHDGYIYRSVETDAAMSLAIADDGITYAVGTTSGIVELHDWRKHDGFIMQYMPNFPMPVDSLAFLTPTLLASAQSTKSVLSIFDITQQACVKTFGSSSCHVHAMRRLNATTLATISQAHEPHKRITTLGIVDMERGCNKHIPLNINLTAPYSLACGPYNTIALGYNAVALFRPTLPSVPDDIDDIPFAAYALAANEDTYEDNCIDDPDYNDDNV